jgi:hypothetical protein
VAGDACNANRVEAETDDQMGDQGSAQIVRRHVREACLLRSANDPPVANVVPVEWTTM